MKALRSLVKFGFFTLILLVLGVLTYQIAVTQGDNPDNFPETGHTITGEFLNFYQQISNPELVYGYPITEQFTRDDGLLVQYFQRARFELHPEAPEGQRVQLTPLGQIFYDQMKTGIPFSYTKNPAICRTFENGIDVCYAFLEFFEQHGGVEQFGQPLSQVEEHGGRLVQYFEYARLDWYPDDMDIETEASQEIQLGFLGRQFFDLEGEDPAWLLPVQGSFVQEIISLQVHAFPVRAVATAGEQQSIYVIVQDQNLAPVNEVSVNLSLTYPNGEVVSTTLPATTNEFGYTSGEIPFDPHSNGSGSVIIEVTASKASLTATTRASFRILP